MPGDAGPELDVVTMDLNLEDPIEAALYDYLTTGPANSGLRFGGNAPSSVDVTHHTSPMESGIEEETRSTLF